MLGSIIWLGLVREAMVQSLGHMRDHLEFQYFFNAGVDKETGICDGEGSDVFLVTAAGDREYKGSVYGYLPFDLSGMSDEEFIDALRTAFKPVPVV